MLKLTEVFFLLYEVRPGIVYTTSIPLIHITRLLKIPPLRLTAIIGEFLFMRMNLISRDYKNKMIKVSCFIRSLTTEPSSCVHLDDSGYYFTESITKKYGYFESSVNERLIYVQSMVQWARPGQ